MRKERKEGYLGASSLRRVVFIRHGDGGRTYGWEQGLRMYIECRCRWPVRSFSKAGRSTRIQLGVNGERGGRRESRDHALTRRRSVGGIARMVEDNREAIRKASCRPICEAAWFDSTRQACKRP